MFDIAETGRAEIRPRKAAKDRAPAPNERDGQAPEVPAVAADHANVGPRASATEAPHDPLPHPASDGGETTANLHKPKSANACAPSSRPSPKGARAATRRLSETAITPTPRANDDHGHSTFAGNGQVADAVIDTMDGGQPVRASNGQSDTAAVHPLNATPLVAEIVETWRQRQAMVEARKRLILQAKALCRRMTRGDKDAANAIFDAGDPMLDPFTEAMAPFATRAAALDRHMAKLARQLPVADFAANVKGFGYPGLAKAVGEIGDFSAYEKGVSGIWKRAGLAVIDGQRQRRVAGAEAAAAHGYAPARRSVFWNIAAAILKGQGTGDARGPYRLIYDARKSYERPRVESDGHAHNRALRYMTKRLLRDMHRAWRDAP